jgi:hypothetical protein
MLGLAAACADKDAIPASDFRNRLLRADHLALVDVLPSHGLDPPQRFLDDNCKFSMLSNSGLKIEPIVAGIATLRATSRAGH